jgi:hypothetical protein
MKRQLLSAMILLSCAGCIGNSGDRELAPTGAALACDEQTDCDGDLVCRDGQCAEPEPEDPCADVLCDEGEHCVQGDCVERAEPECIDDADCRPDEVCEDGACMRAPAECVDDADCQPHQVCEDGACVTGPECVEDMDCAPNLACVEQRCTLPQPECELDADCGPDERCVDTVCTWDVECRDDADCAQDEACRAGRCGPAPQCDTDDECADGDACVGWICRQVCAQDSDCAGRLLCFDGACGQGAECLVDAHCGPAARCRHQACLPWTQQCGVDSDVDGIGDECDSCPKVPTGSNCECDAEWGCGEPSAVYLVDLSSSLDGGRFPGAEVDALTWVPDGEGPYPLLPLRQGWDWPEELGPDITGAERVDADCRPRQDEGLNWNVHAVGGRHNNGSLEFIAPTITGPGTFVLHELGSHNCAAVGYRADPMLLYATTYFGTELFIGVFDAGRNELRFAGFD